MIITYHRIRNEEKSCSIKKFEEQVKKAKELNAILHFDDGLKDHYNILQILKKYDMKGCFFIITNCFKEIAQAHKIWLLMNKSKKLIRDLNISNKKKLEDRWYLYEDTNVANLKYYLQTNKKILNNIFKDYFNEKEEIKKLYMSWDNIKELYENGMVIGNHTHTHPHLDKLSEKEQKFEIEESTKILKNKICKPKCFSYPQGIYTKITERLLRENGYSWATTSEKENLFKLRRTDTNEFT